MSPYVKGSDDGRSGRCSLRRGRRPKPFTTTDRFYDAPKCLCKLRRMPPLLRACQIPVEGKSVAIQIIEGEFARPPRSIANAIGSALEASLPVFVEKRVWVLDQKAQADGPHFVIELKLHVELDRVTAKSDVVRRIGVVSKGQLEAKLPGVELNGPLDVPRAENRVSFLEHCILRNTVIAADVRTRRASRIDPRCLTWAADPRSWPSSVLTPVHLKGRCVELVATFKLSSAANSSSIRLRSPAAAR